VTLRQEFEVAVSYAGLTAEDTRKAQENALEIAFLTVEEKKDLLNRKVSD
jgi:adenosine deaminase